MAHSVNLVALSIFVLLTADPQQASTFECGYAINAERQSKWMAHIQIRPSTDSQLFVCGGTLISDEHVLTAAHCLQDDNSAGLNTILKITLGAGLGNINVETVNHQTFGMKSVAIQSNWNLESDIAIVTLSRPVIFTDYVQPACLPFEDESEHVNEKLYTAGWGVYDYSNNFNSFLRYWWSSVVPAMECQKMAGVGNFSGNNVICSTCPSISYDEHRLYYGDDGGPLMNWNSKLERWFIIGVFGRGELYNSYLKPNVFTRVWAHLDFICNQMGAAYPNNCATNSTITEMPSTEETTATPTTAFLTSDPTTQQASTFECGRLSTMSRNDGWTGGFYSGSGILPWMAHIQISPISDSQLFVCSGTLISDRHVLTAAHCIQDDNSAGLNTILNITLGATDGWTEVNVDHINHQKFVTNSIAYPTNWNLENDIAIITLSRPVIFTDYVQPACLPFENESDHVNEYVDLAGWGIFDECNTFSSVLRETGSDVIPSAECQRTAGVGNFSSDNVICSDGSRDAYIKNPRYFYGDDGGPMIYKNRGCNRWFVIGVAGRGELYNLNYTPNVFTRVRAHLDFIRRETGVASPTDCPPTTKAADSPIPTSMSTNKNVRSVEMTITRKEKASPKTCPPTTTRPTTKPSTEMTGETTTTRPTSPTTTLPSSTTTNLVPFDCQGKPDGNYPNPASDCSITFFMCSNGDAYLFTCAQAGTVYRPDIYACDWPENVAGCSN